VTSRDTLTGLIASDAAQPVPLDLLTDDEARQLLASRLGHHRVAAEPAAVDTIITRCARLPLALAITAARAATRPSFPLAAFAAELSDQLDSLHGDDPATDIRAGFACSYRSLTTDAATLFRLVSLHPGPDLSVNAAASLGGHPAGRTRALLAELARAHLVTEPVPGRYALHDLLRTYAIELAGTTDSPDTGRAAVHRLLDHYLSTTHRAAELYSPERDYGPPPATVDGVVIDVPRHQDGALAWFAAEHRSLLAAVGLASTRQFDTHAVRLAAGLSQYLVRHGLWHDQIANQRIALDAARRLDDRPAQALSLRALAATELRLGQVEQAEARYHEILALHEHLDDPIGHGHAYLGLYSLAEAREDFTAAMEYARQAHLRYGAAGYRQGQANSLNAVGWMYAHLGQYQRAIDVCQEALAELQDVGFRSAEADTWDSLGYAYRRLGDLPEATRCYEESLRIYRELGARYDEGIILDHLGDIHHQTGDDSLAIQNWREGLAILDELDNPEAEPIRAKLHEHSGPQA
jgi:tetratricopeptide (TPR) repeat protein